MHAQSRARSNWSSITARSLTQMHEWRLLADVKSRARLVQGLGRDPLKTRCQLALVLGMPMVVLTIVQGYDGSFQNSNTFAIESGQFEFNPAKNNQDHDWLTIMPPTIHLPHPPTKQATAPQHDLLVQTQANNPVVLRPVRPSFCPSESSVVQRQRDILHSVRGGKLSITDPRTLSKMSRADLTKQTVCFLFTFSSVSSSSSLPAFYPGPSIRLGVNCHGGENFTGTLVITL